MDLATDGTQTATVRLGEGVLLRSKFLTAVLVTRNAGPALNGTPSIPDYVDTAVAP